MRTPLALAVAATLLLAGCGSGPTTTAADDTATTAAGGELAKILKIDPAAKNGKGLTWRLGAALPLSGIGAADGEHTSNAVKLAAAHIKAAGGPGIEVAFADNGSGDAAVSKQSIAELVAKKVPAKVSSYVDGFGAMLEESAKNKILTLDGIGGTAMYAQGVPYFYGTRAITPNDALPGAFEWFKKTSPGKTRVGLVGWDVGGEAGQKIKDDVLAKIEKAGMTFSGVYEMIPAGSTDFSAVLPKVKAGKVDLLLLGLAGQAPGAFQAQAKAAGVTAQELGMEFTQAAVAASKGVFDADGHTFAMDYFDAANPANPLASFFVKEYERVYGEKPDFYAANVYEDTLAMWDLVRRVLTKGGDINDGAQLLAALEANPSFASVYGGDPATVGTLTLDAKTHSVATRPMGVYEYKGGKVTPLATFGVDGEGLTLP
jgi:ABC-type branched-subunit amino acid transport system substrate-binding protein